MQSGIVRSIRSCPSIWGLGFAELRWQMVHAQVIEQTILWQPTMCRWWQSEEMRSGRTPCSKRKCSVRIMSFTYGMELWKNGSLEFHLRTLGERILELFLQFNCFLSGIHTTQTIIEGFVNCFGGEQVTCGPSQLHFAWQTYLQWKRRQRCQMWLWSCSYLGCYEVHPLWNGFRLRHLMKYL